MLNDEIVLQGSVTEDDVRDILWTRIIAEILNSEKMAELRKQNMLKITLNAMYSVSEETLVRPYIGDYVHLGTILITTLSLYALDPLMSELFYIAGKEVGKYGAMQYHLSTINPKIGTSIRPVKRFKEYLKAIVEYYGGVEVPYLLAEEAKIKEFNENSAVIAIKNLVTASVKSEFNETTCSFTAGEIAGSAEAIMGRPAICTEIECQSKGDPECVFKLELVDSEEKVKRTIPPSETKHDRAERRERFFELIHEVSLELQSSLLMKKRLRPKIGDFVHISALQTRIMGLKLMDEFSSTLLYSAGRELGVIGPNKGILAEVGKELGIELPANLKDAVRIIERYLIHPSNYLGREYSFIKMKVVDEENDEYVIEVYDYANSAGAPNVGVKFCDFFAGYLAGRIHILTDETPIVEEIQCRGTGADHCEFLIRPVD